MISPRRADELDLAQSRKKNLAAAGAVGAPRDGFSMRRLPQLGPRPRIKAPERGLQLSNFLVIQFDRRQARIAFGRALPGLRLGASMPSVRIWSRQPGGQRRYKVANGGASASGLGRASTAWQIPQSHRAIAWRQNVCEDRSGLGSAKLGPPCPGPRWRPVQRRSSLRRSQPIIEVQRQPAFDLAARHAVEDAVDVVRPFGVDGARAMVRERHYICRRLACVYSISRPDCVRPYTPVSSSRGSRC